MVDIGILAENRESWNCAINILLDIKKLIKLKPDIPEQTPPPPKKKKQTQKTNSQWFKKC